MEAISTSEALRILASEGVLADRHIDGELSLRALATHEHITGELALRRCDIGSVAAHYLRFQQPLVLEQVRIAGRANFQATYFFGGFSASECIFSAAVDFSMGGHNRNGAPFALRDCRFTHFVGFGDCWFEGPVEISGCSFDGGSNLLGNRGLPIEVQFDVQPNLRGSSGQLALNGWVG